jgi:hypothetical protein
MDATTPLYEILEKDMEPPERTYILIAGAARAGKDTFANAIQEKQPKLFTKIALADELKRKEKCVREAYIRIFIPILRNVIPTLTDKEIAAIELKLREDKCGEALQEIGTNIGRAIDHIAWVKLLNQVVEKCDTPYILVPDCRFKNEFFSQYLLPGYRVLIYASTSTLQRRLDEVKDTRPPFKHESEWMARDFYKLVKNKISGSMKAVFDKQPVMVYDTSDFTGLSLSEFTEEAIRYGEEIIKKTSSSDTKLSD